MKIIEYLNKNFPHTAGVEQHFIDTFGVNINHSGPLFQLKYDQITAKWQHDITHECRGLILEKQTDGWQIVARPWKKFFTLGQSKSLITPENFVQELPNLEWREKADGTAIMVYYYDGEWKASTLGCIATGNVSDYPFTFRELFWKTINMTPANFGEAFGATIGRTYLFELCTSFNQVVNLYDADRVVYLGTIINENGNIINDKPSTCSVYEPLSLKVDKNSFEEIMAFVEDMSKDKTLGKNPEGFVLYKNGLPICKVKNSRYLCLHSVGGGDVKCSRNRIIENIFAGSYDDIRGDIPQLLREFGDSVINKIGCMATYGDESAHQLKGDYPTQKDYACKVQAVCNYKRIVPISIRKRTEAKLLIHIMKNEIVSRIRKWFML